MVDLSIIIPVYNEGEGILPTIKSFEQHIKTSFEVLICFDHDNDTTLTALKDISARFPIRYIKNQGKGPHGAVMAGFFASDTKACIVIPADDDFNAPIIDNMYEKFTLGADIVCANRFIPGGSMVNCPWPKAILVRFAAFTLYYLARLPVKDPTNGFRLFSRKILNGVKVESTHGFTYSIELLAKAHRLNLKILEVSAQWIERSHGQSRFKVIKWLPHYLKWYFYIFATTYLFKIRHKLLLLLLLLLL